MSPSTAFIPVQIIFLLSSSTCCENAAGCLDSKGEKNRPNKVDVLRAFACVIDYMCFCDENTTVNGTVGIVDAEHYSLKLHGFISLEERRDFMQTWQVRTNTRGDLRAM